MIHPPAGSLIDPPTYPNSQGRSSIMHMMNAKMDGMNGSNGLNGLKSRLLPQAPEFIPKDDIDVFGHEENNFYFGSESLSSLLGTENDSVFTPGVMGRNMDYGSPGTVRGGRGKGGRPV
eukprot:TRINITY_DN16992_c0_g1_i1.p1 TRINITY_DN16992_c0_g1~~TRINITY_DN16992_c0_g1_i1.p1  ORF type:complete len:137 (-),score=34.24 TRINITY_DN16992_c0_g1_i1:4-360(-)